MITLLGALGCSARPVVVGDGSPRFVAVDDALVRDVQTGLLWARNANLADVRDAWGGLTWTQANDFVADLGERGATPGCASWRLPTAPELAGLLRAFIASRSNFVTMAASRDIDQVDSLRHLTAPFAGFAETAYWSSTEARRGTPEAVTTGEQLDDAVAVDTSGTIFPLPKSATKRVWPICSAARPPA